jgi:endonuclease YncB( thermonuclease family)
MRRATIACLLLLVGLSAPFLRGGPASAREADRDCDEFPSQAAAETFFVEHGGSASYNFDDLDADHDGIACEDDPCPCSTAGSSPAPEAPPATPEPAPTPEASPKPVVPTPNRLPVTVVRDVDGDTVYVRYSDGAEGYVRLLGVDTPEDVKPDHPVECGARRAAASMRRMAAGRAATLVTDPTQDRFDRYGRLLAYLDVGGRNLDKVQIRDGWGYVYVFENHPFRQVRGFRRAEASAERERLGVWRRCGGDFHSAEPGTQN